MMLILGLLLVLGCVYSKDEYCTSSKYIHPFTPMMGSLDISTYLFDIYDILDEKTFIVLTTKDDPSFHDVCRTFVSSVAPMWEAIVAQCDRNYMLNAVIEGFSQAMDSVCNKHPQDITGGKNQCLVNNKDALIKKLESCRMTLLKEKADAPLHNKRPEDCRARHKFNNCLSNAMEEAQCGTSPTNLLLEFSGRLRGPKDTLLRETCTPEGRWNPDPQKSVGSCGYLTCFQPMADCDISWNINEIRSLSDESLMFQIARLKNDSVNEMCSLFFTYVLPCWDGTKRQCSDEDQRHVTGVEGAWRWMCHQYLPDFLSNKECLHHNMKDLQEEFTWNCQYWYLHKQKQTHAEDAQNATIFCPIRQEYTTCLHNMITEKCSPQMADFFVGYSDKLWTSAGPHDPCDAREYPPFKEREYVKVIIYVSIGVGIGTILLLILLVIWCKTAPAQNRKDSVVYLQPIIPYEPGESTKYVAPAHQVAVAYVPANHLNQQGHHTTSCIASNEQATPAYL